jgi:hypothetical protein
MGRLMLYPAQFDIWPVGGSKNRRRNCEEKQCFGALKPVCAAMNKKPMRMHK